MRKPISEGVYHVEGAVIKGLTLDLYGTLVNQNLGMDGFADTLAIQGIERGATVGFEENVNWALDALRDFFRDFVDEDLALRKDFPRIEDLFRDIYDLLAPRLEVEFDTARAARDTVTALGQMDVLPGTVEFLEWADARYPICLVSDGDEEMVYSVLRRNGLLRWPVVVSEAFRGYKCSLNSPLFPEALRILGTTAEQTLHVGDQLSDIFGAKRAGLHVVHLAAKDGTPPEEEPDLRVESLDELRQILERGFDS